MNESMYDDVILALIEDEQRKDLVGQVWQYVLALEEYVIHLRKQLNAFSATQHLREPFPDPASDFAIRFYGHPAFIEFEEIMPDEKPHWKIPD